MANRNTYPHNNRTRRIEVEQRNSRPSKIKVGIARLAMTGLALYGGVEVGGHVVTAAEHVVVSAVENVGNAINDNIIHGAENRDKANDQEVAQAPHKIVRAKDGDGVNNIILDADPLAFNDIDKARAIGREVDKQLAAAGYDQIQPDEEFSIAVLPELQKPPEADGSK